MRAARKGDRSFRSIGIRHEIRNGRPVKMCVKIEGYLPPGLPRILDVQLSQDDVGVS